MVIYISLLNIITLNQKKNKTKQKKNLKKAIFHAQSTGDEFSVCVCVCVYIYIYIYIYMNKSSKTQ